MTDRCFFFADRVFLVVPGQGLVERIWGFKGGLWAEEGGE